MSKPMMLSEVNIARFIAAVLGALAGVLVALAAASVLFPMETTTIVPGDAGALDWAATSWGKQDFREDREKAFYVLSLLLGGLGGALAARWKIAGNQVTLLSGLILLLSVPLINELVRRAMQSHGPAAAGYAGLGVLIVAGATLVHRFGSGAPRLFRHSDVSEAPQGAQCQQWRPTLMPILIAAAVLALLIIPLDVVSVARRIGYEMHIGFYMIGPATAKFAKGLLPGIDYFTQYSIGTPWLFSHFLASTSDRTLINAVWFVLAEMAIFETTLFFFLWWFFRSWIWALVLTVAILLLQFTTQDPLYAPSSTASRYPLVMVVAILFVHWIKRAFSTAVLPWLALALAMSLFVNTETGGYAAVAITVATLVTTRPFATSLLHVALLGVLTFAAFMLLSIAAFGFGVLDIRFIEYLIEPLLLYGGGLGASPLQWNWGLWLLYNIVSPGLALATVGWIAAVARQLTPPLRAERLAALMFLSVIGLLLTAKFINMSLVALWQVNAWALFVVMAWWLQQLRMIVSSRFSQSRFFVVDRIVPIALAALLFVLLLKIDDPRNPSLYAIESYRTFPSIVNRLIGIKSAPCNVYRNGCGQEAISDRDVALITRLTEPGSRVALFDLNDWVYLVEAKRASKFAVFPSTMIFTRRQLNDALRELDLIFLPRNPPDKLGIHHEDVGRVLLPQLRESFEVVGEGPHLLAWKRVR